ncbi:MAG: hypothetical protein K6U11_10780 [bacterium]|nr:hypothetical protein [bacterium]
MSSITKGIELFNIFAETWGKEKAQIAIRDIEEIIDASKQDLATKSDILELKREIKEVELKIEQAKNSTIRWVISFIIAQTAAIISVILLK